MQSSGRAGAFEVSDTRHKPGADVRPNPRAGMLPHPHQQWHEGMMGRGFGGSKGGGQFVANPRAMDSGRRRRSPLPMAQKQGGSGGGFIGKRGMPSRDWDDRGGMGRLRRM
jgi:hypothetical protein